MGKIISGATITLPAPFNTESCNPIDTRTVVELYDDLLNPETFGVSGKYCYVHEGLTVYVREKQASYTYMGPATSDGVESDEVEKSSNWIKTQDINYPAGTSYTPPTGDDDKTFTVALADKNDVLTLSPDMKLGSEISIDYDEDNLVLTGPNKKIIKKLSLEKFDNTALIQQVSELLEKINDLEKKDSKLNWILYLD